MPATNLITAAICALFSSRHGEAGQPAGATGENYSYRSRHERGAAAYNQGDWPRR